VRVICGLLVGALCSWCCWQAHRGRKRVLFCFFFVLLKMFGFCFVVHVFLVQTEGNYFLKAAPRTRSLVNSARKRIYDVHINPKVFVDGGPPYNALRSIVLHELFHIKFYSGLSLLQFAEFGVRYATNSAYLRQLEHATDACVLQRSLELGAQEIVDGLKEYRNWIYTKLDAKGLRTKKLEYFTPEEIDLYLQGDRTYSCKF
jgi:hypothetical protein